MNQVLCKPLDSDTGIGTTGKDDKLISRVFVILSKDNLLPSLQGEIIIKWRAWFTRTSIILRVLKVLGLAGRSLHFSSCIS